MIREERYNDIRETLIAFLQGWQSDLWSAMPGIIQSVDFEKQSCTVQVPIQMQQTNQETGVKSWVKLPVLLDCPLFFPHGGRMSITFPVASGDECLVVFASRCIDSWWQSGEIGPQAMLRMHDLSDGFALAGFRSNPKVISDIDPDKLVIRNESGDTKITVDPEGNIDLTSTVKVTVNSPEADINAKVNIVGDTHIQGKLTTVGNVSSTGTVQNNGVNIGSTHVHGGVTIGVASTLIPH